MCLKKTLRLATTGRSGISQEVLRPSSGALISVVLRAPVRMDTHHDDREAARSVVRRGARARSPRRLPARPPRCSRDWSRHNVSAPRFTSRSRARPPPAIVPSWPPTMRRQQAAVDEARRRWRPVDRHQTELEEVLQALSYQGDLRPARLPSRRASRSIAASRRTCCPLSSRTPNLKAQRLAFGPATEAADAFHAALDAAVEAATPAEACRAQELAWRAWASVLEIRALHPRHIAEPEDAKMSVMEARMTAAAGVARAAVDALGQRLPAASSSCDPRTPRWTASWPCTARSSTCRAATATSAPWPCRWAGEARARRRRRGRARCVGEGSRAARLHGYALNGSAATGDKEAPPCHGRVCFCGTLRSRGAVRANGTKRRPWPR